MANQVTFDYSKSSCFIKEHEVEYMKKIAEDAKEVLISKSGAGNDFLGWIDLPVNYDKEEFARVKAAAEKIKNDSEVLLVIGIGGSYLGARAAIEFLRHNFYNIVSKEIRKTPEIYFVGNSISSTYIKHLIDVIGERDFSINMISKSGTTTEPAIAFRVFKELLEKKYGKDGARKRIYCTTDGSNGLLLKMAKKEGYKTFTIPKNIGGRYSVLTAVGLLPICVSGADIRKILIGARDAYFKYINNLMKTAQKDNRTKIANTFANILTEIKEVYAVLGLFQQQPEKFTQEMREKYLNKIELKQEFIIEKINERAEAKKEKNFELADQIRAELDEKGIILNDTVNGTTWDIKELY